MREKENKTKMKGVICPKYGSPNVLKLTEIDIPQPKDDEVLIRNYGSSINTVDVVFRRGGAPKEFFWLFKPIMRLSIRRIAGGLRKPKKRMPGFGFAGEIISIGKGVIKWQAKDHVYGYHEPGGAYAEYIAVKASILAKKPSNLSFQEAAAVPGGASPALAAFRDIAEPRKGQKVLIIAASGGNGTFAVQIAKNIYGAEVTGVCGPTNIEMVKEIGADYVIDYTKEDYIKSNKNYDIIFDAIGANTFSNCKNILTDEGVYITTNPVIHPRNLFQMRSEKFKVCEANDSADTLNLLRVWIESGKIKPVIDNIYPLDQIAEAHRHYETGHSKGRVVISIE